ncbi:hypothetical protein ASG21_03670 [Chryseobacterium sp. Leaf394]|nr:hypothetical protein ASG21_03670 [Chryseobacterium sp. Leaf394]
MKIEDSTKSNKRTKNSRLETPAKILNYFLKIPKTRAETRVIQKQYFCRHSNSGNFLTKIM